MLKVRAEQILGDGTGIHCSRGMGSVVLRQVNVRFRIDVQSSHQEEARSLPDQASGPRVLRRRDGGSNLQADLVNLLRPQATLGGTRFQFFGGKIADGRVAFVTPSPDGGGLRTPVNRTN